MFHFRTYILTSSFWVAHVVIQRASFHYPRQTFKGSNKITKNSLSPQVSAASFTVHTNSRFRVEHCRILQKHSEGESPTEFTSAAMLPRTPHDPCTDKFLSAASCNPRATLVACTTYMELVHLPI